MKTAGVGWVLVVAVGFVLSFESSSYAAVDTLVLPAAERGLARRYKRRAIRSMKRSAASDECRFIASSKTTRLVGSRNAAACAGDASCLARIGAKFGVERVVGVMLRHADANDFAVTYLLAEVASGQEIARRTYFFEHSALRKGPGDRLVEFLNEATAEAHHKAVTPEPQQIVRSGPREHALLAPNWSAEDTPSASLKTSPEPNVASVPEADGVSFSLDVGLVSTYYFRGAIVSDDVNKPAVQPGITMSFANGLSVVVWGSAIIGDRERNSGADEIDFAVGYSAGNKWVDVTVGYVEYIYPNSEPLSATGEMLLGLSAKTPVLTPSITSYVGTGGLNGTENAPIYLYTELGLANELSVGPGTLASGVTFGLESLGKKPRPSDLRLTIGYEYSRNGVAITPGLSLGLTLDEDKYLVRADGSPVKSAAWASLNVAY